MTHETHVYQTHLNFTFRLTEQEDLPQRSQRLTGEDGPTRKQKYLCL